MFDSGWANPKKETARHNVRFYKPSFMEAVQTVTDLWKNSPDVIRQFVENRHNCERLAEEVAYVLKRAVRKSEIEYAAITHRAKALESFCEKIVRKEYKRPFEEITDMVGVRIVYLYASDKTKIESVIKKNFLVVERVDNVEQNGSEKFGYGALHFLVKLGKTTTGARYDDLKDMVCELQVRTILQDAWAIVGHHLSYKRESDVPIELRRKLHALAGLFETADDQFDRLNLDRLEYSQSLRAEINKPAASFDQDLNLDSLVEYLKFRYPDREQNSVADVAELLKGLKNEGIFKLSELDEALTRAEIAFEQYESFHPPGNPDEEGSDSNAKFAAVGVVRVSMEILSDKYLHAERKRLRLKISPKSPHPYGEFRHLVKPAKNK